MELNEQDRQWLADQRRPVAVLFNAHGNCLGAVHSLAHHGIPVVVLSPSVDLATQSHYSRWVVCPPYRSNEFPEFLLSLGKGLRTKAVIIPFQDHLVQLLLDHNEALKSYFHLPLPSRAELEAVADKYQLLATAGHAGLAIPRSFVEGPVPSDLTFPVIVKPLEDIQGFKQKFGRSVVKLPDRPMLDRYLNEARAHKLLVQEFIAGEEDRLWTFGAAFVKGVCLADFTGRKLIQYPPGAGAGDAAVAQARLEPRVAEAGRRLLSVSRFTGIAQVEFKKGPDERLYVIEVNPRSWSWNYLTTACGVNLPLALYCAMLGKKLPLTLTTQFDLPLRWCYGRLWFLATLNLLLRGRSWIRIFKLGLSADNVSPIITQGDGGPLLVYLKQFAKTLMGELAMKVRGA